VGSIKKVNSIARAAHILRCIARGTNRLTKIVAKTGLSNGTVHRLAKTLQAEGFVEQDPLTLKYTLGPLLIGLTIDPSVTHENLIACSIEEMERLRQSTRETVGLVIRSGLQRLHIEELPSDQELKYSVGKGFTAPIYTAASSKVLLSELSVADRKKIIKIIEKDLTGQPTKLKVAKLLKEIAAAKKSGYAVSFGETINGAASIAVPVKGYVVPIAMCIFGPMPRFDRKKMKQFLPDLKKASGRISKRLQDTYPQ
jgi:IclR family acetate operon transcriptional repressor